MTKFDGIKKRFGKIEKEIEDKELAKIGTKDLERIVADINQMKVDINLAKEQARENLTDVSIDDLGAIFKESEEIIPGGKAQSGCNAFNGLIRVVQQAARCFQLAPGDASGQGFPAGALI